MRRDEKPILLEILAQKASTSEVIQLRKAGSELFLATTIPVEIIVFPLMRQNSALGKETKARKEKVPQATITPTHGSFFPDIHTVFGPDGDKVATKGGTSKERRGPEWKRNSRKERGKRGF
jgi:hypothetical protein